MTDSTWDAVAAARAWLDASNGTSPLELTHRILKLTEEAGEAAAAWIGANGQNPRKGVTHTYEDVADELADVAFTALVAIASLGFSPEDTLARCAQKVAKRLPQ
ncbi:hypothetical protein HH310_09885 [Actinoplanes sp. TBRC 11911]|uniref:MazG-like family protein n=1 Tax=Actinoplanes sp. TBRC 11911 TaxID=2729386 RepID=UPI00145DFDEA|nr:MazG-like family protein [Actinoplanes sp. TBRC 11911]NMO51499.1 hypothetical protein [Actinoplanes sp. TBRC 11911]